MSERLGKPFITENRPGAGNNIATEVVAKAAPDGYTLLLSTSANSINATLYDRLNFNFIRDIAPVASLTRGPLVLVVNPSFPARTVPEFIAHAKANPHKLNIASSGNGTVAHVAGELFKMLAGLDMTHVPYRGSPPHWQILSAGKCRCFSTRCCQRSSSLGRITASFGQISARRPHDVVLRSGMGSFDAVKPSARSFRVSSQHRPMMEDRKLKRTISPNLLYHRSCAFNWMIWPDGFFVPAGLWRLLHRRDLI